MEVNVLTVINSVVNHFYEKEYEDFLQQRDLGNDITNHVFNDIAFLLEWLHKQGFTNDL